MNSITINGEEYFNVPLKQKDINFLWAVLIDYKESFIKECDTYARCEELIKILDKKEAQEEE